MPRPRSLEILNLQRDQLLRDRSSDNMAFAGRRIVAFATAAALGQKTVTDSADPKTLKDLVTSVPHHREISMKKAQ